MKQAREEGQGGRGAKNRTEERNQSPEGALQGQKTYQILLNLQPQRLELHESQGACPAALGMLKANTIKPVFPTPYGVLSLVTLHNECVKASVNVRVYNKQGPGGLGGGSGWETHSDKGEQVKHSLRPAFETSGGKGPVKSPEPTSHLRHSQASNF